MICAICRHEFPDYLAVEHNGRRICQGCRWDLLIPQYVVRHGQVIAYTTLEHYDINDRAQNRPRTGVPVLDDHPPPLSERVR